VVPSYSYAGDDPLDGSDPSGLGCGIFSGLCGAGVWADEHLNPVYFAVGAYANEAQAYEDGCSLATVAGYGAEGAAMLGAGAIDPEDGAELSAAEDGGVAFRSDASHIFRDDAGHLLDDTPANRDLIQGAVKPENLASTITLPGGATLATYFETLPDGSEVWVEVRNGTEITNGGLNASPK
jgi:hypothetical protein